VHLHTCVTDGVFVPAAAEAAGDAPPTFVPSRPVTPADLTALTERVQRRVVRWFRLARLLDAAAGGRRGRKPMASSNSHRLPAGCRSGGPAKPWLWLRPPKAAGARDGPAAGMSARSFGGPRPAAAEAPASLPRGVCAESQAEAGRHGAGDRECRQAARGRGVAPSPSSRSPSRSMRKPPAGAGPLRTGGSHAGEGQDGFARVKPNRRRSLPLAGRPPTGASSSKCVTTATSFRRHPTSCPQSTSTASDRCRTRGYDKAARRPDSERLRADTRKTPLQGEGGRSREPLSGPGQAREAGATGSRVVHQSDDACGSAIGRAIHSRFIVAVHCNFASQPVPAVSDDHLQPHPSPPARSRKHPHHPRGGGRV
jgi:hypothetical protein